MRYEFYIRDQFHDEDQVFFPNTIDLFEKRLKNYKKETFSIFSSPHTEGDTSIMQRALCPWEARVNYEEARHPHIISEAMCLCRRSRGASGAFCLPIKREVIK